MKIITLTKIFALIILLPGSIMSQELKLDYFKPDKENRKIKRIKDPCLKGSYLYDNGDYDEAIAELTKCINQTKPSPYGNNKFLLRGAAFLWKGEIDKAYDDLSYAVSYDNDPSNKHNIHFWLGICLEKLDKIDEAIIETKKGIEIIEKQKSKIYNTKKFLMYLSLTDLYYSSKKYKEAIDPIEKAIKYAKKSKDLDLDVYYFVAGAICYDNRKYEKSKYYFDEVSNLNTDPGLLFYRGRTNYCLNNKKSANMDFYKVIELDDPPSSKVAFSYFFIGEKQKAFEILIERVDNSLGTEEYKGECYDLACMYSLNNDIENSIKYLTISAENGYDNFEWLKNDSDMDNIRNTQEFKDFLIKYDKDSE